MSNTQVTHSISPANARSESSIAINPHNPNQMVAGSKKFTNPMTYEFTLATSYSHDGGINWQDSGDLPLLSNWTGISDPAICWDDIGNAYLLALPFNDIPVVPGGEEDINVIGIAVYKSTDKGVTWGNPKLIHTSAGDDKQWIAADKNNGNIYAVWDDGSNMRFARSTNHGNSWKGKGNEATGSILTTPSFSPEINVADNGNIYICYMSGNNVSFIRSIDAGQTFSAPTIVAFNVKTLSAGLPSFHGWPHFPGATFRVLTVPTGCAGSGNVVVVAWADMREGSARIYYRRSLDGGVTWLDDVYGQPLITSAISPALHHFHPQIVAQPNGTIGCSFYEVGPKGAGGKMLIDVAVSVSHNSAQNFPNYHIVTDEPWDPTIDAPFSHGDPAVTFIGDYFGLDASANGFYPLWTDTRTNIQELFTNVPVHIKWPWLNKYMIYIHILFGITNDGGGVYVDANGHIHIVPSNGPGDPGPVLRSLLDTLLAYKAAEQIRGKESAALQKEALKTTIALAQKQLKKLNAQKR
ncbi:MAG: exo-alpha-sialidase [Sphingobacteriales bacterium]|nr:exo-alpha-sialidase [Sphingobacteriales bacterium]